MPQNKPVYEPETSGLLDRLIGDGDVFFDVGANWGWYSVLIATRSMVQSTPLSPFRQLSLTWPRLSKQAGLDDRISCHDVAPVERDGEAEMSLPDGFQSGLARLGEKGGRLVRLARLDNLPLPAPSTIKIDAEDHELEVLEGATDIIDDARPFIVFESWLHPNEPRA